MAKLKKVFLDKEKEKITKYPDGTEIIRDGIVVQTLSTAEKFNHVSTNASIPIEDLTEKKNPYKMEFKYALFDMIKKLIETDETCIQKSIKLIQHGTRLIVYQGQKSNIYGIFEYRPDHLTQKEFIRIHNSTFLRILKSNEITKEKFKDYL